MQIREEVTLPASVKCIAPLMSLIEVLEIHYLTGIRGTFQVNEWHYEVPQGWVFPSQKLWSREVLQPYVRAAGSKRVGLPRIG